MWPQPRTRLRATLLPSPTQASFEPGELAEVLAQRVQVGQRLAGMRLVGQPVDDRAVGVAGDFLDRGVLLRADDDHVDHFAQHAGEVGDALALAEADVVAEHDAAAAQVGDAGLEADPRPQRLLLEQQGQRPAGQERLAQALGVLRLEVFGDGEDPRDFGGGDVAERDLNGAWRLLTVIVSWGE